MERGRGEVNLSERSDFLVLHDHASTRDASDSSAPHIPPGHLSLEPWFLDAWRLDYVIAISCMLFVVCWLLYVCLLFVVCCMCVCYLLFAACCLLLVVCCVLIVDICQYLYIYTVFSISAPRRWVPTAWWVTKKSIYE